MCENLLIANANIIVENGILENYAILIKDDTISKILPSEEMNKITKDYAALVSLDAQNAYVSPGFIDMHSDDVESVVQPRPSSMMDFDLALSEQEKQLVNQGITTMYHSISFEAEENALREKQIRTPENLRVFLESIEKIRQREHLIRHRFHCRFDIRNISGFDTLLEYIENGKLDLLSFTDHSPGQGQFRDTDIIRDRIRNKNPELSEDAVEERLRQRMNVPKLQRDLLEAAAVKAHEKKLPIASHDDDSFEKLDFVRNTLKSDISEFPVEIPIARKAKQMGMLTAAGAPNVLLGRSHTNNLSATEAILDGCIDILCSDYYPASLLHAVFKLNRESQIPLWQAINMVTVNPARALKIDGCYGSIAEGKKADILFIKLSDGKPVITKVLIDGQLVSALNYRSKGEKRC